MWKKENFLVAQEQKLGARGQQALLEHSLASTHEFPTHTLIYPKSDKGAHLSGQSLPI